MLQPEDNLTSTEKIDEHIEQIESYIYDNQPGHANHGLNLPKKEILVNGLISDLFDKTILETLEQFFERSSFRHNSLPAEQFKELISHYIPRPLVESVYRSIDVNDVGYVNYSDFTNYLIASEAGSSFSAKIYISRLVPFLQQEDDASIMHRDAIDCLVYVKRPCPMIISGGRDGQLSIWDPDSLLLMKNIDHRDKNDVYQEGLRKSMNMLLRAQTKPTEKYLKDAKMAITSLCPVFTWGMLCVGSADSCVTVYELGNQDVCGRITNFDTIPSAIECFQLIEAVNIEAQGNNAAGANSTNNTTAANNANNLQATDVKTFIAIGDSKGTLHIVKLHPEFGNSTEVGMKKKNQILFAQSVKEGYSKMQVHTDWITQVHYIAEINSLITASADSTMRFVDVIRGEVTKVFNGHQGSTRIGINNFRWSSVGKYIVSGADRTLLFWDPYTLEIMNRNDSLRSPLIGLEVCDPLQKVFAALSNKTVLVWHNITLELLQSISDTTIYKPTNVLSSMIFVPEKNMMFTAGNRISAWTLEKSSEGIVNVDEEDLCTVIYNTLFNQILVVKALGTFKIYQAETGEIVRQFMVRPIDPMTTKPIPPAKDKATGLFQPLVLHACLDKNQTRLIIVGSNLSVQYWNIHDGSNLIQVNPQLYSTSLAHVYSNYPKSIASITQDILIMPPTEAAADYPKRNNKPLKLLLIGTEFGHVCVYHEIQAVIEPIPAAFLRAIDHEIELFDSHHTKPFSHHMRKPNKPRKISFRTVAMKAKELAVQHQLPPTEQETEETEGKADDKVEGNAEKEDEPSVQDHQSFEEGSRTSQHGPTVPAKLNNLIGESANPAPPGTANKGFALTDSIITLESSSNSVIAHALPPSSAAALRKREIEANKDPVIWMHLIPKTTHLLTCYLSGRLVIWDLQTDHKIQDFNVKNSGAILNAMRMKNHKSSPFKAAVAPVSPTMAPITNINFIINTQVNNKLLQQMQAKETQGAASEPPATIEMNAANDSTEKKKNPHTTTAHHPSDAAGEEKISALGAIINNATPHPVAAHQRKESDTSTNSTVVSHHSQHSHRSHSTTHTEASHPTGGGRSRNHQPQPPLAAATHRETAFARKTSTNSYQKNRKLKNSVILQLPDEPDTTSHKKDPNYHPRLESVILAAEKGQLPTNKAVRMIREEEDDEEGEEDDESNNNLDGEKKVFIDDDDEYYNPDDHDPIILNRHRDSLTEEEKAFLQFKQSLLQSNSSDEKKEEKEKTNPIKLRLEFMKRQQQNQYFNSTNRKDSAAVTVTKHYDLFSTMKDVNASPERANSSPLTAAAAIARKSPYEEFFDQQEVQMEEIKSHHHQVYNQEMKHYAKKVKQSIHSVHRWTLRMNSALPTGAGSTNATSSSAVAATSIQKNFMENITNYVQSPTLPPPAGGISPRLLSSLEENSRESLEETSLGSQNQKIGFVVNEGSPSSSALLPSKMVAANLATSNSLVESVSYNEAKQEETEEETEESQQIVKPFPKLPFSPPKSTTAKDTTTFSTHRPSFSSALRARSSTDVTKTDESISSKPPIPQRPVEDSRKPSYATQASNKSSQNPPSRQNHHHHNNHHPTDHHHGLSVHHETSASSHQGSGHPLPQASHLSNLSNSSTNSKIIVDFLVVLPETQVMIGACNDRYLRFFDLETLEVLCSCLYISLEQQDDAILHQIYLYNQAIAAAAAAPHHHHQQPASIMSMGSKQVKVPETVLPDEVIRLMTISDSEDVLVAGYNSGMIRIWSIHSYSITTLRNLLYKYLQNKAMKMEEEGEGGGGGGGGGDHPRRRSLAPEFGENLTLAISPLALIGEFRAHNCPILSLEYVWFDYEADDAPPNGGGQATTHSTHHQEKDSSLFLSSFNRSSSNANTSYEQTLLSSIKRFTSPEEATNQQNTPSHVPTGRKKRHRLSDMGQEILEGYVTTAGLDQRIFLWTLYGKCVGEFGTFGWDINNESTWNLRKYNPYDGSSANVANKAATSMLQQQLNKKKNQQKRYGNTVSSVLQNLGALTSEFPGVTNPYDLLILKQYKPKQSGPASAAAGTMNSNQSEYQRKKKYEFSAQNITKESLMMKDSSSNNLLSNFFAVATQHSSLIRHQYEANREQIGSRDQREASPTNREDPLLPAVNNAMTTSGIAVKDMHLYVEKLTKKIVHRPPAYEQVNNEFQSVLKRHPIVMVNRNRKSLDTKKSGKSNK